uniref:Ig-like domain-containing protein n=1 Tax=Cyprinus carpio TaxID=7962 RepID=A0A8C1UB02_CYPCA
MTKWLIITLFFITHGFGKNILLFALDVEQPVREKTSAEGDQVTLLCNYTIMSSANAYLFWYKQLPNRSPTFILSNFSIGKGTTEPEFQERFHAKLDSKLGTVPLTIKNLHVSDSAVYYCNSSGGGDSHTVYCAVFAYVIVLQHLHQREAETSLL